MAARRWLLFLLSLGSLVILVYVGVAFAFSVPVTGEAEAANRAPDADVPREGLRALVVPAVDPSTVPTFAENGTGFGGTPGALVAVAEETSTFPAGARNVTLARALAYVPPEGAAVNATVNLTEVPGAGGNGTAGNLSLDLARLAGNRTGFVVKADNEAEPRFVEAPRVLGQVERFESPGSLMLALASGSFGFVAPLVLIILTHRGAGRRGGGGALPVCRECRAPMPAEESFCTRCGAWREPKP